MANHPPRLEGFSYIGQHRYFLTICARQRRPVFKDSRVARQVIDQFLRAAKAKDFEVFAYCAMPDQFHGLVMGLADSSDLQEYVRVFKQRTGYWWKHDHRQSAPLWEPSFYERVLREEDRNEGVIRYILMNPVRASLVSDPREYPYLGAEKYDVQALLEGCYFWTPPWK
jgi:REP element-mobilizing transposase RayT